MANGTRGFNPPTPAATTPNAGGTSLSGRGALGFFIDRAQKTVNDPTQDPGAQRVISTISGQLARAGRSARGEALGRLTRSGQAGFGGGFGAVAGELAGRQSDALAKATADIFQETLRNAQASGLTAAQALSKADQAAADLAQRQREAALSARQAQRELNARERQIRLDQAIRQATLAEQTRQFNVQAGLARDQFGESQRQFNQQLGFQRQTLAQQESQFARGFGLQQQQFREGQRQFDVTAGQSQQQIDLARQQQEFLQAFQQQQQDFTEQFQNATLDEQKRQFDLTLEQAKTASTTQDQQNAIANLLGLLSSGLLNEAEGQATLDALFDLLDVGTSTSTSMSSSSSGGFSAFRST